MFEFKVPKLQIISLSSIGCVFDTLNSDWKTAAVAFSLFGDICERRCPWRVPDVDCCLHNSRAAKGGNPKMSGIGFFSLDYSSLG